MLDENKNKILAGAESLFLKYGFKNITMDDIARELGVSKKTLYQFFDDKSSLVDQTVSRHIEHEECACRNLRNQISNPIDYMLMITDTFGDLKKQINQSILYDLKKYFKSTWEKLNQFRIDFIYSQVLDNLKKGKEMGLYHENLNENLVARFYIHLIDFMLNPDNYHGENTDFKTVHTEMVNYHLRSICTPKGATYLKKQSLRFNQVINPDKK
ncbi:MAG: TetR/AcrR family transcriptional regulator [Bacteroidota bacterium]|nr:TetR/AcrR family transcriptional regulator [Bacteroidota bacterium]